MVRFDDITRRQGSALMSLDQDRALGWVCSLRELYDGVAEEPMPPAFGELIARLGDADRKT